MEQQHRIPYDFDLNGEITNKYTQTALRSQAMKCIQNNFKKTASSDCYFKNIENSACLIPFSMKLSLFCNVKLFL